MAEDKVIPKLSESLNTIRDNIDSITDLLYFEYSKHDTEKTEKVEHIQSLSESISDDIASLIQYAKDVKS